MSNYGIYKCEHCHAEFLTLDEKFKHIKKFHSDANKKAVCNFAKDFRQSCIWEYDEGF